MRIIFVRHGEPDYVNDCLTDEGRRQAAAAAERLAGEGISAIYASPCGRAAETAACTAARLGLPVTTLDFMHEISWGGAGIPCEGPPGPWATACWRRALTSCARTGGPTRISTATRRQPAAGTSR